MTNLFDPTTADRVKARLHTLRPDTPRQWGTMSAPQAVAHCSAGLRMALGDIRPKRALIGRIIGPLVKSLALGNDSPMRRNSPTAPELVVDANQDMDAGREQLCGMIDRFAADGPAACTTHPHPFFGKLTPSEWAELMYKHLDHHLRQFGA